MEAVFKYLFNLNIWLQS